MAAPEQIEFRAGDDVAVATVVERLGALAAARRGWVNFEPEADPDEAGPSRSMVGMFIAARGPDAPLVTWKPGAARRQRVEPTSIGIQHAAGPKAVRRLQDDGVEVPAGWRVVQDHPRRGLVVLVPDDAEPGDTLRWLLTAATALSVVPLTGWWRATIYAT